MTRKTKLSLPTNGEKTVVNRDQIGLDDMQRALLELLDKHNDVAMLNGMDHKSINKSSLEGIQHDEMLSRSGHGMKL